MSSSTKAEVFSDKQRIAIALSHIDRGIAAFKAALTVSGAMEWRSLIEEIRDEAKCVREGMKRQIERGA